MSHPERVPKTLKTEQMENLQQTLYQKLIHGVHFNQCLETERDTSGYHIWPSCGCRHRGTDHCCTGWGDPHLSLPGNNNEGECLTDFLGLSSS